MMWSILFLIEFVPHGTYLTREKTEADTVYPGGSNKAKKETVHRKAYLQLDVLKPGDIFVSISVVCLNIWARYAQ